MRQTGNFLQTRSLLGTLTGLRIQSLLETEAKPECRQDEPTIKTKMTHNGREVLSYHRSERDAAAYFVLKRYDLGHYFKAAEYATNSVREITRENLVEAWTADVSIEPAGDECDENDNDASAAEEQEPDVNGECGGG